MMSASLLKVCHTLHDLFVRAWKSCKVPVQHREGIAVSIYQKVGLGPSAAAFAERLFGGKVILKLVKF